MLFNILSRKIEVENPFDFTSNAIETKPLLYTDNHIHLNIDKTSFIEDTPDLIYECRKFKYAFPELSYHSNEIKNDGKFLYEGLIQQDTKTYNFSHKPIPPN